MGDGLPPDLVQLRSTLPIRALVLGLTSLFLASKETFVRPVCASDLSIHVLVHPPSAYSYKFVGTFSCGQIDLRKARERDLATLDERSTSSGIAEPLRDKN